jgi:hypothetical protein
MPSEARWFVWLNWLIAEVIAVAILFFQGRWLTPDVYTVPLGRCGSLCGTRPDQGVAAAGGDAVVGGAPELPGEQTGLPRVRCIVPAWGNSPDQKGRNRCMLVVVP